MILLKRKKNVYQCEVCRHVQNHPDKCDECGGWTWNMINPLPKKD
jgi:primosomal protein N'